jgi:phosphopantetheinyl transferase (holo-ACP synthase)
MVGNDVVDLRDPDALPEHAPRFDARVFCDEELVSLDASACRARRRWRLWAAKEAAYKVAVKEDPTTVFSPSQFRVHLPEIGADGVVEMLHRVVPVRVSESDGAVHAVVTTHPDRLVAGMTRVEVDDPGRAVRRVALECLAVGLKMDAAALEIRKSGRIPELWIDGERAVADLSLSHHGDVVGFACEFGNMRSVRPASLAALAPSVSFAPFGSVESIR